MDSVSYSNINENYNIEIYIYFRCKIYSIISLFFTFYTTMFATKRGCSQSFLNFLSDSFYSPFIYFRLFNTQKLFLQDEIGIIFPNYVYNPYYLRHYLFTFFDNFIPLVCIYRFKFSVFFCYNQYSKH